MIVLEFFLKLMGLYKWAPRMVLDGRELPVTLHQDQCQLSKNGCIRRPNPALLVSYT
jgi:hypothetical protein